jgi:hypothetical protein
MSMMRFLFLWAALWLTASVNAQNTGTMKEYALSDFGFTFMLADRLAQQELNGNKFFGLEADGSSKITIYAYGQQNLKYDGMQSALMNWAKQNPVALKSLNGQEEAQFLDDLNGFWGVYYMGTAEGTSKTSCLMLLIDPNKSDVAIYIWYEFDSGKHIDITGTDQSAYVGVKYDLLNAKIIKGLIKPIPTEKALTEYTWSYYKMKYKIPQDFVIKTSTGSHFQANNKNLYLDIYPFTGQNLDYKGMEKALTDWIGSNQVQTYSKPAYIDNLNNYWGVYMEAEKDGWKKYYLLILDPDFPDIAIYVAINYLDASQDHALEILTSFEPM